MIYINLIVFFSILSSSLCVRPYTMRFVSYTSEYRNEFFQSLTIKLLNHSQVLAFNGSIILSRDLDKIDVTVKAMVNENNKRKPWKLLDTTIDFCKFIGGESKLTLGLILKNIKSFDTLLPDHCPVKKGIEYYVKNFQWDEDLYPPQMPNMSLNVSVGVSHKNERIYTAYVGVVIDKKSSSLPR